MTLRFTLLAALCACRSPWEWENIEDAAQPPVCEDSGKGCPCVYANSSQDCYAGPKGTLNRGACKFGRRTCTSELVWTRCIGEVVPKKEICNGIDDDCNDVVDDTNDGGPPIDKCFSPACGVHFGDDIQCWTSSEAGICGAGTMECEGCVPFLLTSVPEVCNGYDDDCNGEIDDKACVGFAYCCSLPMNAVGTCSATVIGGYTCRPQ